MGLAEHILVVDDDCKEIIIATVKHCFCTLIVCVVRNHLAKVVVPLWCPTRDEEAIPADSIDYMPMQVDLWDYFV